MEQIAAAMESPPSNHRETDQPARPRKGGLRTMPFIIGNNNTQTQTVLLIIMISLVSIAIRVFFFFLTINFFLSVFWEKRKKKVNESFEKVASYGLMPNMIFYLMNEYHMQSANGASILFFWAALSNGLAIVGAFLSDSYLGRFRVITLGSFSTLLVSLCSPLFFLLSTTTTTNLVIFVSSQILFTSQSYYLTII
jgi:hypothetical protein